MKSLKLDRNSSKSIYQQMYTGLLTQILSGELPAGSALPSYRQMSQKYKVTVTTVDKAYSLLEMYGYIERKAGKGCYVRPLDSIKYFVDEVILTNLVSGDQKDSTIDFISNMPNIEDTDTSEFFSLAKDLCAKQPETLFAYPPTKGTESFISAVSHYHTQRNMPFPTESLCTTSGVQQAINLICTALISQRSTILIDDPTYSVAANCFRRTGAKIIPIPLLADGPDLNVLEEVLSTHPVDFYYTMPACQCPTNITWSPETRKAVIALSDKYGFTIIEDDCLRELWYEGTPVAPIFAEANPDRVIYLNTFSKYMLPGLRLGYIIAPKRFYQDILLAKFNSDLTSPAFYQEIMAVYLESGRYDRHLQSINHRYKTKYMYMNAELNKSYALKVPFATKPSGVFFWVQLPPNINSVDLWVRMLDRDTKFLPGPAFSSTNKQNHFMRLSFTNLSFDEIERGIKRIDHEIIRMKETSKW